MRITKGDLVIVSKRDERGSNTMSQLSIDNQKIDILKLDKGATGVVIEAHVCPGWMLKHRILFETGHALIKARDLLH